MALFRLSQSWDVAKDFTAGNVGRACLLLLPLPYSLSSLVQANKVSLSSLTRKSPARALLEIAILPGRATPNNLWKNSTEIEIFIILIPYYVEMRVTLTHESVHSLPQPTRKRFYRTIFSTKEEATDKSNSTSIKQAHNFPFRRNIPKVGEQIATDTTYK